MEKVSHLPGRENKERLVGIEIEFIGVPLDKATDLVAEVFGGQVEKKDEYIYHVTHSEFGEFRVECDSSFVKSRKFNQWLSKLGIDLEPEDVQKMDEKIAQGANVLIPFEIITPPLPLSQIDRFDELIEKLKEAKRNLDRIPFSLAPCGLHINVEAPSLEVKDLQSIVASFSQSYDNLVEEIDVDKKRQIAPYIAPYPREYRRLLMNPSYEPDIKTFFEDYLKFNPTRNRALDLTTIIGHMNWELLEKYEDKGVELELIKPRPAFHYRLPNCHLDDEDWNFKTEWQRWVKVENKAETLKTNSNSKSQSSQPEAVI